VDYLWAVGLVLVLLVGWTLTMFNLPGNWVMVIATGIYAYLMPQSAPVAIGWVVPVVLACLAGVGELLEFLASAAGVATSGGSKRGAALAIVGSVVGSIIGAIVGLPIPIVGSVVAAILFAAVGALLGAMLGEEWKGRTLGESWKVGQGAFWGRLLGSVAKITIASAMVAIATVAIFLV
jgi:uncharacterized protein YqgC (DUF456 family)